MYADATFSPPKIENGTILKNSTISTATIYQFNFFTGLRIFLMKILNSSSVKECFFTAIALMAGEMTPATYKTSIIAELLKDTFLI
jgi:hypothetical protein